MAITIENEAAEKLLRELVSKTGESETEADTTALRERLVRLADLKEGRRLADDLDRIAKQCASLPVKEKTPARPTESSDTTRTGCQPDGY